MNKTQINPDTYKDKVKACWLGKNIAGTLGAPFEGVPHPLELTFYDPVPSEPIPNDDLELQLVWLHLAEQYGLDLNYRHFAHAWQNIIKYGLDEYGVAKWNLARGLTPPQTGLHNNWFTDGMGALIRSEIWACLFPGQPKIAAHFARLDSSVDHAGDGVWAEMFLAAAQSAAFLSSNIDHVFDQGLKVIPSDSRVAQVVNFTRELVNQKRQPADMRGQIVRQFGSHNFTDCVMNTGFITMAMFWGQGDFEKTILAAVNCGMDTDCTGASCGAFMGILLGAQAIPPRWLEPISDTIAVGDAIENLNFPADINELTERTITLSQKLLSQLDDAFTPDLSPVSTTDTINDNYQWLVFPAQGDFMIEPPELVTALKSPQQFPDALATFPQIHMDLAPYCQPPKTAIYLLTNLKVPTDVEGFLLLAADTGITAWLDDQMILNYHGRLPALPSCHRVDGGAAIPVKLQAEKTYQLKIRLIFCHAPLTLTAAILDLNNQYIPNFKFTLEP